MLEKIIDIYIDILIRFFFVFTHIFLSISVIKMRMDVWERNGAVVEPSCLILPVCDFGFAVQLIFNLSV